VTVAVPVDRFEHEALFYRGDDDFLAALLPFIREGLDRDETVVVAEPGPRLGRLRDALGRDARSVEFLDMGDVGANPNRIIGVWAGLLESTRRSGRRLRGVGEPAFPGRRSAEFVECTLHERLLNHAFDDGPGWRLLCPYDRAHLPRAVTQGAARTHPVVSTADSRMPSSAYEPAGHVAAFAEPLRDPGDAVLSGRFGAEDLAAIRRTVGQWARSCGLPADRIEVLRLVASELATNSIRHGGGAGTLALWLEDGAALVQFTDTGTVADPLIGRLHPPAGSDADRGLYLVNQLCDLVQVRSSEEGTTVRVVTWL
jgi:anti-sigma regulatory factor (Ser/Thr protein kinase)